MTTTRDAASFFSFKGESLGFDPASHKGGLTKANKQTNNRKTATLVIPTRFVAIFLRP